jgi:hypothetical protein
MSETVKPTEQDDLKLKEMERIDTAVNFLFQRYKPQSAIGKDTLCLNTIQIGRLLYNHVGVNIEAYTLREKLIEKGYTEYDLGDMEMVWLLTDENHEA